MLGHEVVAVEHGQAGDTGVHPQGTSQTKPGIQEIQEIYRSDMRYIEDTQEIQEIQDTRDIRDTVCTVYTG